MTILDQDAQLDADIVRAILRYENAKSAYRIAKKMAQADLQKVARTGFLTKAEDELMRASVREAEAALAQIRELIVKRIT